ncbi:MAG: hypothetical protein IT331_05225 [Anaerolineae bacterium]|nr:hypothetical protein [Anaerolineae bacterium]
MIKIARIVWVILAGLAIGLSVIGMPVYYAQLQGPCVSDAATCSEMLIPTTAELAALQAQGWSPQQYALMYTIVRSLQILVWVVIGLLIFVRKPNDRGALIISLALILSQTSDGRLAIGDAYPALNLPIQFLDYVASISLAFLLITFPDGRVVPRVMWIMIVYWVVILNNQDIVQ